MKVVITGGAGFLGTRLARKLVERNTLTDASGRTREIASITLLDVAPAAPVGDRRVRSVVGDLGDASLLEQAVPRDTDAVFHLEAAVNTTAAPPPLLGCLRLRRGVRIAGFRCRTVLL